MSDENLLRALHDQHAGALWTYVLGLTGGDRTRAQDIVQETLLRAWRNPGVLDPARGSPRPWLFTVARRITIDEWRAARSHHETVTDRVPEQPVDDPAEHVVDRQLVAAALRRLSKEHRDVLRECYFRGSSVGQAAQALGIAPGTVKSRTHFALRALRLAIDELGGVS
ncbi:sigma-70 family RNA polymerase sigma factor [Pseudofrankia asymbiotica]|uniref:sigma-70 family RNA polymerase sigma factor n=1 Tax=Pseudofrankia asymbiotica TaxID=1834516 RepID=UPI001F529196|nr:sigma-70 family RNA polymerase sigma factor [Pseudofrankia asymbiotica]